MYGAIKAQFINAEEQQYDIQGKIYNSKYITIIDEHARGMTGRYTQLKIREENWTKLNLNNLNKIKEYQGKLCQFSGIWEKNQINVQNIKVPQWVFYVTDIKEATIIDKK